VLTERRPDGAAAHRVPATLFIDEHRLGAERLGERGHVGLGTVHVRPRTQAVRLEVDRPRRRAGRRAVLVAVPGADVVDEVHVGFGEEGADPLGASARVGTLSGALAHHHVRAATLGADGLHRGGDHVLVAGVQREELPDDEHAGGGLRWHDEPRRR
jgi:hypothetical protein